MKGKDGMGRECRAMGGGAGTSALSRFKGKNTVMKAAEGSHSDNDPDDALSKGGVAHHYKKGGHTGHHRGMRARGGRTESDYKREEHNPEEGMEKRGGRIHKKKGGMIEGDAKMPHMGRARRARGGKTADLNPMTHDAGMKPKHRHVMSESESVP